MSTTEEKRMKSPDQPVGCWIRPDKRWAIYLRDNFECGLCNVDMFDWYWDDVTLDHIVPVSKGGSNEAVNLYACCKKCNSSRQAKSLTEHAGRAFAVKLRAQAQLPIVELRKLAKRVKSGLVSWDDAIATVR